MVGGKTIIAPWHAQALPAVLGSLRTRASGLTSAEAEKRAQQLGANTLPAARAPSFFAVFVRQFMNPLIFLLLGAAVVVFALRETLDGIIILTVLVCNAAIGALQEGRAHATLLALRKLTPRQTLVLRNGTATEVAESVLVPGDVVLLTAGDRVPADCRVIEARSLSVDESSLTGESVPVEKHHRPIRRVDTPLAEQHNMLFHGTVLTAGDAEAVVVAIGRDTALGKISSLVAEVDTEIPLAGDVRRLSRAILVTVLTVGVVLFGLGVLLGKPVREMFVTIVSLIVSVVPEELPIVLTLVLAAGVGRMSKRHALVKRLQAVEALGQTRVLAVDKTGTITANELTVVRAWADGSLYSVEGTGYATTGRIRSSGSGSGTAGVLRLARAAALLSRAHITFHSDDQRWSVSGDPTEAALSVFAEKAGVTRDAIQKDMPLLADFPFQTDLQYRAAIHGTRAAATLFVSGAPEAVVAACRRVATESGPRPLDAAAKKKIATTIAALSRQGMRVIALAEKAHSGSTRTADVSGLTLLGVVGMQDVLRPDVADDVRRAQLAGMRVCMITGDHRLTAEAIARDAGILRGRGGVLTGHEIDTMSEGELRRRVLAIQVFARVTPEHKMRIIQAFRQRGLVVAMTGDGVNDAPPLVAADLGIAMGRSGTEVAKEAADIVLLDDNLGSIIAAVEEGRDIFQKIQKTLLFQFSTAVSEMLLLLGALAVGLLTGTGLPLLPAQILWVNLVGDGILGIFFAYDPREPGLLDGRWRRPGRYILELSHMPRMVLMAVVMAAGTLGIFLWAAPLGQVRAQTMAFVTLALYQWINAWNCRSRDRSLFTMNPFANASMLLATSAVIALQVVAMYTPWFQSILKTVPLTAKEWLVVFAAGSILLIAEEVRKAWVRISKKQNSRR